MKTLFTAGLACALAAALSGCAGMPGMGTGGVTFTDVAKDLQTCSRHYVLAIGSLAPVTGSLDITCNPTVPTAAPTAPAPAAAAAPAAPAH